MHLAVRGPPRHLCLSATTAWPRVQGKTSRWAVAWSWQVDPNKAMQPLRRLEDAAAPSAAGVAAAGGAAAGVTAGSAAGAARAARQQALASAAAGPTLAAAGLQVLPRRHVGFTVQKVRGRSRVSAWKLAPLSPRQ